MKPTFFTDRDLGKSFPAVLSSAGILVERHADHFKDDTQDDVWLAAVGRRGWVAVSRDERIRYHPNERDAVIRAQLRLLIVVGKATHADLAANFVRTIRRIEAFLENHDAPFIAKVYRPTPAELARRAGAVGRVDLWYP